MRETGRLWKGSVAVAGLLLLLAAPPVGADEAEERAMAPKALEPLDLPGAPSPRFYIQEENDAFGISRPTDNYYTQGLQLGARWRPPPAWRRVHCDPESSREWREGCELWGFELGQNIYTSTDITATDLSVLVHDRPYAAYLYVGPTFLARLPWDPIPPSARLMAGQDEGEELFGSALSLSLRFGQTGPKALGDGIQTGFHTLLNEVNGNSAEDMPAGWGIYETRNVFSLDATAALSPAWIRLSTPVGRLGEVSGSRLALRASPGARIDLGGVIDAAELSLEARLGLMSDDVGRGRFRLPIDPEWLHLELYLWGKAAGRFVAYNRLIEGALLHGVHTQVHVARWVGDLTAGLVVRAGVFEAAVVQQWRTAEFHPVPGGGPRIDNFGSIRLGFLFE
jgi:hypothetical protein